MAVKRKPTVIAAVHSHEITGPFHDDTNPSYIFKRKVPITPEFDNAESTFHADTGHPENHFIRGPVDFYRKEFPVPEGPGTFGIQLLIKIRFLRRKDFFCLEMVEPKEPVCLVQPVLPGKGRPP